RAGFKTIYAQSRPPVGALTRRLELEIGLLADGPNISAFNLSEGDTLTRPVEVAASASSPVGISSIRLEANGAVVLSSASDTLLEVWDISPLPADLYRLRLVAEDNSGNIATRLINITVDPQPAPAPVIQSPANNAQVAESTIDLAGRAEANVALRASVNGSVVATGSADAAGNFSFADVPLVEGGNQIVVTAFDAAGSSGSAPVTVVSDTTSPIAPVLEAPLYDSESGLLIQWRYGDGAGERPSRYKVFWDTAPFADYATAANASAFVTTQSWSFSGAANQTYYFRVVGYDTANNPSAASNQVSYDFDDTPPVISIFYSKSMPVGAGALGITLQSNEPL